MISKEVIKETVEKLFNVKVLSVNTFILAGKKRRLGRFQGYKNTYKRVFVTLMCYKIYTYVTIY